AQQRCEPHPDKRQLCAFCNNSMGMTCVRGLVCLIDDTGQNPGDGYCATSCSDVGDCPGGYARCIGLNVVGDSCSTNLECSNGGRCVGSPETDQRFCECVEEADCNGVYDDVPNLGSLCDAGQCRNMIRSCETGLDCACNNGACEFTGLACESASDCGLECVQVPSGDSAFGQCRTKSRACVKDAGVRCESLDANPRCAE
ncbi:MAG: hypothetical protein AAFQ82_21030, partial [Myxococcota bacterium]